MCLFLSRIPTRSLILDSTRPTLRERTKHNFQKEESATVAGNKILKLFSPSKSSTNMNKEHAHPIDMRSTEMSTFVPVLLKLGISFSLFCVLTIQDAASL